ncbi:hypothetical protein Bhyg_03291, partial [Pseudolycoriella hygida]
HLNERLDYDKELQENLRPLASITSSTTSSSLQLCHSTIIPDLSLVQFLRDYEIAANSLCGYKYKTPFDTLQKLQQLHPNELNVLKIALARVVAAKPHAADVERLICSYNKMKTIDRLSLYNFLYIKINMPNVDRFDPKYGIFSG